MTIKEARQKANLSRAKMSEILGIPTRTIQDWELQKRTPSEWVERLIIKELDRLSNPFKNFKASAVIDKPLPSNFEYAAEYAVETPEGDIGALLCNKDTGRYVVICGDVNYSCPQEWAMNICKKGLIMKKIEELKQMIEIINETEFFNDLDDKEIYFEVEDNCDNSATFDDIEKAYEHYLYEKDRIITEGGADFLYLEYHIIEEFNCRDSEFSEDNVFYLVAFDKDTNIETFAEINQKGEFVDAREL
ncbi:MAG: helix-turn-helix transcriptional regulator [Ruminococcus sp.]|nr:helix-turn-helix transcriptional regulator [Ruminococcus sp.]